MAQHKSIAGMPAAARPRERLERVGLHRLRDAELMALLIGSGTRTASSLELGRLILKRLGGPAGVQAAGAKALREVPGVGAALAARIAAAMELARRGGAASGGLGQRACGDGASAAVSRP
jgi:DNA repair protein RadC